MGSYHPKENRSPLSILAFKVDDYTQLCFDNCRKHRVIKPNQRSERKLTKQTFSSQQWFLHKLPSSQLWIVDLLSVCLGIENALCHRMLPSKDVWPFAADWPLQQRS